MPVDLSMVGLRGIEAGQNTLSAIASREALQTQTQIAQGTFDREQQQLELDRQAVENAKTIMAGEGRQFGGASTTEDDMARFMALTGSQLAAAGAPKRGAEMMEASLDLTKKRADINKAADDQDKVRLDNMITAGDYMYEMLSDSGNESEYQFNLANIPDNVKEILGPDNIETLKNTPWSPELVDYFKTKALSVKDQAQLELTAQGQRRQEQQAADLSTYRKSTLEIARQRAAAADRAQRAAEKVSGANVSKAATGDERLAIRSAIANVLPNMGFAIEAKEDSLDLMGAINDIAAEAKQLVVDSPGLSFNEAANRAVLAAQARGDFESVNSYRDWGLFKTGETKEQTYKPKGRTKENPVPLPEDKSKWVKGRFYIKNGKVGQYGTDFE